MDYLSLGETKETTVTGAQLFLFCLHHCSSCKFAINMDVAINKLPSAAFLCPAQEEIMQAIHTSRLREGGYLQHVGFPKCNMYTPHGQGEPSFWQEMDNRRNEIKLPAEPLF